MLFRSVSQSRYGKERRYIIVRKLISEYPKSGGKLLFDEPTYRYSAFVLTVLPVLIVGAYALMIKKMDYPTVSGMLCGSMANPVALNYASTTVESDMPSVSYATVYPLCMFVRVIIAQLILIVFM